MRNYSTSLLFSLLLLYLLTAHSNCELFEDVQELRPVEVQSTIINTNIRKAPFSVGLIDKYDIQYGKQTLTLDESLTRIPGV